jgi:hypothetical protein
MLLRLSGTWASGTGTLLWSSSAFMPSGYTIDETALNEPSTTDKIKVGDCVFFDSTVPYIGSAYYDFGSNRMEFGTHNAAVTEAAPFTWTTSDILTCDVRFPIAEWAGSQSSLVGFSEATSTAMGLTYKNRYEKKYLAADASAAGALADLAFTGLTVGRHYRLTLHALMTISGTSSTESCSVSMAHDGATILLVNIRADAATDTAAQAAGGNIIFQATATSTSVSMSESGTCIVNGDNNSQETWAMVEELRDYEVTTDF